MAVRLSKKSNFWNTINTENRVQGLFGSNYQSNCSTYSPVIDNISDISFGQAQTFLYGSPLVILSDAQLCRIDLINGFSVDAINSFSYITNAPGSFSLPFRKNRFLVTLSGGDHPNSDLINNNNYKSYTNGLGLSMNGLGGRTIYLVRGSLVVFSFAPPCDTAGLTLSSCNQFDPRSVRLYFTTNPMGGPIEETSTNSTPAQVFEGTRTCSIGSELMFFVKRNLPPVLYYQCTMGPFMGGLVVVLDRYLNGDEVIEENFINSTGEPMGPPPIGMRNNFDKSCLASGSCLPKNNTEIFL